MTRKPTENGEAYLAFVQARDLQWHLEDVTKLRQAEQLYERALHLDGNFALAMAGYSQLESWLYHSVDPWPERREKARALASSALQSQPDLPEAHLAHGFSHYYGDGNYDAAFERISNCGTRAAEQRRSLPRTWRDSSPRGKMDGVEHGHGEVRVA